MLSVLALASIAMAYGPVKPYNQDFSENTNVLKMTGNIGPFSTRRSMGISLDPPQGCKVDQVILYHRHGERYPDYSAAVSMEKTWAKIAARKGFFTEELEFANYWVPFTTSKEGHISQESTVGAYSGLHTGYYTGLAYVARYGHLWDPEVITPVFASGTERIVDTARRFVEGFFGYNTTSAAINIIPETDDQGGNSLTPSCHNSTIHKSRCGKNLLLPEFTTLANYWNHRFGTTLTATDIVNLFESTAFELNVRGDSPWVKAFPSEAWVAFEHYISSTFWCNTGPGSENAIATGTNFLNASRELLIQGPETMPMSYNFAHDTNITPVMAALGLDPAVGFNETYVQADSGYHLSDVMPMGGRLTFERLACKANLNGSAFKEIGWASQYPLGFKETLPLNTTGSKNNATFGKNNTEYFVRILVNEAVVPLDVCNSGPGLSCPLEQYSDYVDGRIQNRTFSQVCNVTKGAPKSIDFWWKYNTTAELNAINSTLAYQALLVDYLGRAIPNSD